MKKAHFISTALIAITVFTIYNCSSTKGFSTYKNKIICSNYSKAPLSKLPIGLVKDMIHGYKKNQLTEINGNLGINDAQAISFDLETLKRFVYHIEAISKSKDSTISDKDLGVRIYYAAYPEKRKWKNSRYAGALDGFMDNPITEQYEKLHTIIIMPTIKRDETYFDFNPTDIRTYTKRLQDVGDKQKINDYSNPENTIVTLSLMSKAPSSSGTTSTVAQNHGGLFPPNTFDGSGF
ncbi:hypothetical protein [uncultured Tenacibaculum sp.]|uniref:hypothetical protein n=1 Tax=uncultured Tenacibaculum sp. TaxID=174713 RepID=UPI00261D2116|nr:hypothetical protein [uncultured Tenacibaculum sp.]